MSTVLLTDPDRPSRQRLAAALRYAGYQVHTARNPRQTAVFLRRTQFDAIILDPNPGGPETVAAIRPQTAAPILVVTHARDEAARVAVLDAGADDCVSHSVGVEELLARVRVALRRAPQAVVEDGPITTTDFTIHVRDRRWLRADGSEVHLTPIEWRVVETLAAHRGHLVRQDELLKVVWGPAAVGKTNYLRVQLAAIRRKVEPDPAHPRYFITAPGLGLRFDPAA
jgi:two-component system KDP operon response regulator KdpE